MDLISADLVTADALREEWRPSVLDEVIYA